MNTQEQKDLEEFSKLVGSNRDLTRVESVGSPRFWSGTYACYVCLNIEGYCPESYIAEAICSRHARQARQMKQAWLRTGKKAAIEQVCKEIEEELTP